MVHISEKGINVIVADTLCFTFTIQLIYKEDQMGKTCNSLCKLKLQDDFVSKALEDTTSEAKVQIRECIKLDLREPDYKNVHWVEQV
jgi:hypothetical protein